MVCRGNPRRWRLAAAVLVFAIVVRAAVLIIGVAGFERDVDGYRRLAENLRATGVFGWVDSEETGQVNPTRFRPPLYPLLLAALIRQGTLAPVAVGLLHLALGIATVGSVLLLSSRSNMGRWSALAALLVACDPILLFQSTQIMTETLAAALATFGLVCLAGSRRPMAAGMAGAVMALAILCRSTFLPWFGLCFLTVLIHPAYRPHRWAHGLAMLVCASIVLAPWMVRNYRQTGTPRVTTSHGGYTLLLGNNPSFYDFLEEGGPRATWDSGEWVRAWKRRDFFRDPNDVQWADLKLAHNEDVSPATGRSPFSEEEDDRFAYALARRYLRERPVSFAYSCLVRVGRLWQLTPNPLSDAESVSRRAVRYLVGGWYGVLSLLAFAGALSLGKDLVRPPWIGGLLLCVTFTAVHCLYWSNMRMRAPLMPFVCLVAAAGANQIVTLVRRRKSR